MRFFRLVGGALVEAAGRRRPDWAHIAGRLGTTVGAASRQWWSLSGPPERRAKRAADARARHIANRKLDVGTRTRRGRYTKVERAEGMSRDRESHRIALMERNARFYVEQATLAGRSATAILQGDPPPGCSRIGCKPTEEWMAARQAATAPVARLASSLSQSTSS